jgi:hypothetical protein
MARASGDGGPKAFYGYSLEKLWLRLELPAAWLDPMRTADCAVELELTQGEERQRFIFAPGDAELGGPARYVERIVELCIPLRSLRLEPGPAQLSISCSAAGPGTLRLPATGTAALQLLGLQSTAALWSV